MTYRQALDYLFNRLPMYQRIGPAAYKADLGNTLALSRYLGHPERSFPCIHLAGTNGKGSVSHMLASVLQAHGMKTGLATSPHLRDFRERIRVNGQMIPRQEVVDFVHKHRPFLKSLDASFFEIGVAMTFDYFSRQSLDIAVIETGLGGRLDSTNIVHPLLSVITNIGMDHTHLLGDTIQDIAREKAGIIKAEVPVLLGRKQEDIFAVFEEAARRQHAPLYLAADYCTDTRVKEVRSSGNNPLLEVSCRDRQGGTQCYRTDLLGHYQAENLLTAVSALHLLNDLGLLPLQEDKLRQGLASVGMSTGLLGRWQIIMQAPLVICDAGHNPDGMQAVMAQLKGMPYNTLRMVMGMVNDKSASDLMVYWPREAVYYFCKPDVPRGMEAETLAGEAGKMGFRGQVCKGVRHALQQALDHAGPDDIIFVGGSTFVVAEVV